MITRDVYDLIDAKYSAIAVLDCLMTIVDTERHEQERNTRERDRLRKSFLDLAEAIGARVSFDGAPPSSRSAVVPLRQHSAPVPSSPAGAKP